MSLMTCRAQVARVRQLLNIADGRIALHRVDICEPGRMIFRLEHVEKIGQRLAQVADDCRIGHDVLVDFRRIDVDESSGVRRTF